MGIGYGSKIELSTLSPEQIGKITTERDTSDITLWRILITIAEIGIGLTGVGVIPETIAGVAAGVANQVLDTQTGSVSGLGTFLNIATPFIGGAFSGGRNVATYQGISADLKSAPFGTKQFQKIIQQGSRGISRERMFLERQAQRIYQYLDKDVVSQFNRGARLFPGKSVPNLFGGYVEYSLDKSLGFKSFTEELAGRIASNETDNAIRELEQDSEYRDFLRSIAKNQEDFEMLMEATKNVRNMRELRSVFISYVRDLDEFGKLKFVKGLENTLEKSIKNLDGSKLLAIRGVVNDLTRTLQGVFKSTTEQIKRESRLKRWFRLSGTRQFNDEWVQKLQLIDPNDFGRMPVETLYQHLKGMIRGLIGDAADKLVKANDFMEAFQKSGGIRVDSQWHVGYRIIKRIGMTNMTQITYGKDTGNFTSVIVFATDRQLKMYRQSPGRFYRNTWALSLGKAVKLESLFGVTNVKQASKSAVAILGLIPVPQLRNILSIVSNYVENISDMATGRYFENYWEKFTGSLKRTAISRAFRLVGKEVLGGAAGKAFGRSIGNFIGKELQRVGTQIFATGVKNVIAGKEFSKGLGKRAVMGTLVSVRSHSLRRLRHKNPLSVTAQTLSARRKLQQVKRIPNAVVPGRPFKGGKMWRE